MAPQEIIRPGRPRSGPLHGCHGCMWVAITLVLIVSTSGETLSKHGDVSLAVKTRGEAGVVRAKQHSVIRRELTEGNGDNFQDVKNRRSEHHGSRLYRSGKHLVHRQDSATRSGFSLWANVTGFGGGLCAHTGLENYEAHLSTTEQASSLEACMTHCESTPWCSTMSFHGDPLVASDKNACVVAAFPCTKAEGKDATDDAGSPIANALDDEWITMNYTQWSQQFEASAQKHCVSMPAGHETKKDINSLEDCMALCENARNPAHQSWCQFASYKNTNNDCDLMMQCVEEANVGDSGGFDVFKKGNRDTVAEMGGTQDTTLMKLQMQVNKSKVATAQSR